MNGLNDDDEDDIRSPWPGRYKLRTFTLFGDHGTPKVRMQLRRPGLAPGEPLPGDVFECWSAGGLRAHLRWHPPEGGDETWINLQPLQYRRCDVENTMLGHLSDPLVIVETVQLMFIANGLPTFLTSLGPMRISGGYEFIVFKQ